MSVGKLTVFNRFLEIFAYNMALIVQKLLTIFFCQNPFPAFLRREKIRTKKVSMKYRITLYAGYYIQGDQINMAVFSCTKEKFTCPGYTCTVAYTGQVTHGTKKTRPCLTGHPADR